MDVRTALAVASCVLAACPSGRTELRVDLKTDLTPIRELRGGTLSIDGSVVVEFVADAATDYLEGTNLASVEGLSRGLHDVELQLDVVGEDLQRRAVVDVRGRVAITLLMSRSCRDVDCPEEGPTQCRGGTCVDPECVTENVAECGIEPECMADADCESDSICGTPRCIEGSCLTAADQTVCAADEICDPERGCGTRSRGETPTARWSMALGDRFARNALYAVALDESDNIYVTGRITRDIDLGGGLLEADESDILVASFDPEGVHRWSRVFGGPGGEGTQEEEGLTIAVGDGSVWVGGRSVDETDFGGGVEPDGDGEDGFVLALDSTGGYRWSRVFADERGGAVRGIATDDSGNVYLAGEFFGDIELDDSTRLTSAGDDRDVFFASYDNDGALRWFEHVDTPLRDSAGRVRSFSDGLIWFVGSVGGDHAFGDAEIDILEDPNAFVAAYAPDGTAVFARGYGQEDSTDANDLAMAASGALVIGGAMRNGLNIAGQSFRSQGSSDGLIFGVDAMGTPTWAEHFGHPNSDGATTVVVDGSDNAIVTGEFERSVDFGGGLITATDHCETFLASYAPDGAHRWSIALGGPSSDVGEDLALDSAGDVVLVGAFADTVDFGTGELGEAEGRYGYIVKLSVP